ncbi:hypothetical protein Enr13x_55780 [Stieleria neptunia]|uniref:Uncharacterized protein n=1 Tax=Stieleria neptunia TaxID=2527979 RepID=A0A518HXV9_9BACT|nr:hypothetical protein Enr13x_55780 [Stieleria neptunia]
MAMERLARKGTTSFPGRRDKSLGRRPGKVRRPFQVVGTSPSDDGPEGPSYVDGPSRFNTNGC